MKTHTFQEGLSILSDYDVEISKEIKMSETTSNFHGSYNRFQRRQINLAFKKCFRECQRQIDVFEQEYKDGEELAGKMAKAYRKIKEVSNPTFDEKVEFLKSVAPAWEGV